MANDILKAEVDQAIANIAEGDAKFSDYPPDMQRLLRESGVDDGFGHRMKEMAKAFKDAKAENASTNAAIMTMGTLAGGALGHDIGKRYRLEMPGMVAGSVAGWNVADGATHLRDVVSGHKKYRERIGAGLYHRRTNRRQSNTRRRGRSRSSFSRSRKSHRNRKTRKHHRRSSRRSR